MPIFHLQPSHPTRFAPVAVGVDRKRRESILKHTRNDIFIIGFALFSMFFGAGNVIFPPYLGLSCGSHWFLGFLCYFVADIGLALLALFAMLRCGSTDGIIRRIGKVPSTLLMSAIVLCIGPMIAIPRTAATTYEMSLAPLVSGFSPVLFSALFFLLILLLCLQESAVVDIVGKFLTPGLLVGLLALIVTGIVSPIGPVPDTSLVDSPAAEGIRAGYQTLDVLAALVFGTIILKSAESKGHTDLKSKNHVVAGAGIVAGVGLLVVYLGLTYLGVTTSRFFDLTVNRTFLVVSIVRNLLGFPGVLIFSIVVALACVTTAVGLVTSVADYFSRLSGGRISYKVLVVGICVFSTVLSNFGLDQIVSIAAPILDVVYPPTLVLILLAFLGGNIRNDRVHLCSAAGALVVSLLTAISAYGGVSIPLLASLPLASLGFGWVVPAAVCGLLGLLLPAKSRA